MIVRLRRLAAYALFISLCFYFLLPVSTSIPGLSTITVLKAAGIVLALLSAAAWLDRSYRLSIVSALGMTWPAALLAAWMMVVSTTRPSLVFSEAKLMAGFSGAVYLMVVLMGEMRDECFRKRSVFLVVACGVISIAAALLEPFLTPSFDWFWRLFRPNLPVWNSVLDRTTELARIHWIEDGQFRVGGILSDPNHFANFLNVWFPLLCGVVCIAWRRRWAIWVPAILMGLPAAYAMGATLTRSAVLAAGIGSLMAIWLILLARCFKERELIPGFALVSGFAGLVVGVVMVVSRGGVSAARIAAATMAGIAALVIPALFIPGRRFPAVSGSVRHVLLVVGIAGVVILAAIPANKRLSPVTSGRLMEPGEQAVSWRAGLWEFSARELCESPVIGVGYMPFIRRMSVDFQGFRQDVSSSHNLYLSVVLSGGVVALGLFLHFLVILLRSAFTAAVRDLGPPEVFCFGAVLSWYWLSYVMLAVFGQEIFPIEEALTFFAWAALTLAWTRNAEK